MEQPPPPAAESFDRSAQVYDGHVAVNRAGARRLVASVPEGRYPRLLDVGCGTGFASLEAIPRLGVERIVGVDASASMLQVFRERLRAFPHVTAELEASDVLRMRVEDASADLVLCTMALHWFTERAVAIARMGRALAPGGVLGILAPGPAHDRETVALVRAQRDPVLGRLADSIEDNEIDPDVLAGYLAAAGLEPEDVWTETRLRAVPPAAYGARMEAVASHLWSDLSPGEQRSVVERMRALFEDAAGADGLYRYSFVKTFAIATSPRAPQTAGS
jgi:ubiquinone/menaquinone biosynthesis C-methylase UbiE